MSAATARRDASSAHSVTGPSRQAGAPSSRPPLRVVARRHGPARAPFVLLVAGLLGVGLVTVLLINTWLAQGAFTLRQLQNQQTAVRAQTQAVAQAVASDAAPAALASRAAALGLVPAPDPVFKAADGHVMGVAEPAVAPPPPPPAPEPTVAPTADPTANPTASPTASPTAAASSSVSTSVSRSSGAAPATPSGPTAGGKG